MDNEADRRPRGDGAGPGKIFFFGLFGQQNWGNECTLQAIVDNVLKRLPTVEMKCICSGPEDTSGRYGIPAVPIREGSRGKRSGEGGRASKFLRKMFISMPAEMLQWARAFRTLKGADMIIAPGTGLLTDYAMRPFGLPYGIFKWTVIAKLRRCKVLFVSVGAGPINHPLSRLFIRLALSLADYRSFRDIYSRHYIESVGFRAGNDPVYPDLAFSLNGAVMSGVCARSDKGNVIGVGLKDYYGEHGMRRLGKAVYRDYIEKTSIFVEWLLQNGYMVRVLMGDGRFDGPVKEDLMASLKERGNSTDVGRIIDEPVSSVEDLLEQLKGTDMVVSPRFHNILLAMMLDKPVISLSYHEKFASLMAEVGLAEYCQHLDHLDVGRLIKQFQRLEKEAARLMPYVRDKAGEYRMALDEQYGRILCDVESGREERPGTCQRSYQGAADYRRQ